MSGLAWRGERGRERERERVRTSSSHFHVAEAHPGNDIAQEGRRGRGSGAAFADGGAGCTEPQWTLMDSLIHLMDVYGFVGFYGDLMGWDVMVI